MSTGLVLILLMLLPLALWAGWTLVTIIHTLWMHYSEHRQEPSEPVGEE